MNVKLVLAALTLAATAAAPAFCDTINFAGGGNLGHSNTYTAGSSSVIAYAFSHSGNLDLFGKGTSGAVGAEDGLGIAGNSDSEITDTTFIQLDISRLTSPFTLSIGSTQGSLSEGSSEGFSIYVSNTLGSLGTLYQDFHLPTSNPFPTSLISTTDRFVSIQADGNQGRENDGQGNVLVNTLTTTPAPVPEPGSLILLGTGILGLAGAVRRKLSA